MTVTQLELYHDPSHLVTIPPILLQPPAAEAVATVFTHSPSWPLTKAQLTNVSGFLVIYCDLWAMAAFSRSDHSGLLNCSLHRVRNSMLNPWRGSTCRPPGASLRSTDITDFWEKRGLPSKVVLLFCCILDKSIQRMSESHTNVNNYFGHLGSLFHFIIKVSSQTLLHETDFKESKRCLVSNSLIIIAYVKNLISIEFISLNI